jgi:Sigma-70 region 2
MTPTGPDEEDAVAFGRVLAGDLSAFSRIVERWQGRLINLAWRFCRDRTMAEDMAQEAFVKAFRALRTFSWSIRVLYLADGNCPQQLPFMAARARADASSSRSRACSRRRSAYGAPRARANGTDSPRSADSATSASRPNRLVLLRGDEFSRDRASPRHPRGDAQGEAPSRSRALEATGAHQALYCMGYIQIGSTWTSSTESLRQKKS